MDNKRRCFHRKKKQLVSFDWNVLTYYKTIQCRIIFFFLNYNQWKTINYNWSTSTMRKCENAKIQYISIMNEKVDYLNDSSGYLSQVLKSYRNNSNWSISTIDSVSSWNNLKPKLFIVWFGTFYFQRIQNDITERLYSESQEKTYSIPAVMWNDEEIVLVIIYVWCIFTHTLFVS